MINKENEEKKAIDLNSINNNLACLRMDFDSLSHNFLGEIEDIKNNLSKQNILKNKELIILSSIFWGNMKTILNLL